MNSDNIQWKFTSPDPEKVSTLAGGLGISVYTAQLLINRGLSDIDEARSYLSVPEKINIKSWDSEKSNIIGKRIKEAVDKREIITIHGDYDVDGITGSAILSQFLKAKNAVFNCHLPNRFTDGYGLNCNTIDKLAAKGTKVIITADCGVSNTVEIEYARQKGIDVIVTDHHTIPAILPDSPYLFHPGLTENSGCEILSGAGTAMHLIASIDELIPSEIKFNPDDYVDLAAIGTIADVCPLTGVNRPIVQVGLSKIGRRKSLNEMLRRGGLSEKGFSARDISFKVIPLLNAAGRMEDPKLALELLLAEDEQTIDSLLGHLEKLNNERKQLGEKTLEEIEQLIEENKEVNSGKVLVIAGEHFHHGIIGILCARLVEKYNKPVFLLTVEGKVSRGSARSKDIHLVEALKSCSDLLEKFGGHKNAAGFSIKTANISEFRKKVFEFADTYTEQAENNIEVELEIPAEEISEKLYNEIKTLEPFGEGNPQPSIGLRNCRINNQSLSKNGLHLFAYTGPCEKKLKVNFWKSGSFYPLPDNIDLIYEINENKWNNRVTLELNAKSFKVPVIKDEYREIVKAAGKHPVKFFPEEIFAEENKGYLYNGLEIKEIIFPYKKQITAKYSDFSFKRFTGTYEALIKEFSSVGIFIYSPEKKLLNMNYENKTEKEPAKVLVLTGLPLKTTFLQHIIDTVEPKSIIVFFEKIKKYQLINSTSLREILKLLYINSDDSKAFIRSVTEKLDFSLYEISKSLKILQEANFLISDNDGFFINFGGKGLKLSSLNSYNEYVEEQQTYEQFCNIMLKGSLDKISEALK